MIRVLLADDHALVRAGIRALLQSLADIEVVAEASNGREALHLMETLQPAVALLDIGMAEMNGLEAAARAAKVCPQVRVLILSMHANEEYVLHALRSGASGYLLKDAGTAELELAVRAAAQGELYLSPAISRRVVTDYMQRTGTDESLPGTKIELSGPALLEPLTPRQREVLQLIAEGCGTQQIAQKLGVSTKTVETHRAQIMDRLNLHEVAALIRYAIRAGLVQPDA